MDRPHRGSSQHGVSLGLLSALSHRLPLAGIDLAWGDKRSDGICIGIGGADGLEVLDVMLARGDADLLDVCRLHFQSDMEGLIAIDAPVVCPNPSGCRPVDREAQARYRRFHAGPHPCNQSLCERPLRVASLLGESGFLPGWTPGAESPRVLAEVFPHPALVAWGSLDRTIKYKRGPVAERRREFRRLQELLIALLRTKFSEVRPGLKIRQLLEAPWTKEVEDQTDAFICLLIGWQHIRSCGLETQILGDTQSGFMLLPGMKCGAGGENVTPPL